MFGFVAGAGQESGRGSTAGNKGHGGRRLIDGRREERDGDSESGLSSPWQPA